MLLTPGTPQTSEGWLLEAKLDGARALARITPDGVALQSRPGNSFTARFPDVARELTTCLGGHTVIVGGELVALDDTGMPSFTLLQTARVGELWLCPDVFAGTLELTAAKITLLRTTAEPPRPLVAAGWEVGDVHGPLRHHWDLARRWLESGRLVEQPLGMLQALSPKQLRAWKLQNADLLTESGVDLLIRRSWFRPWQHRANLVEAIAGDGGGTAVAVQPWTVLAAVYDRAGDPDSGKRLRVAAAQQVTRQSFRWPTVDRRWERRPRGGWSSLSLPM